MNLYKATIYYWKPSVEITVLKENVKFTTDRDKELYESDGGFCDYIYRNEGDEVDVLVYAKIGSFFISGIFAISFSAIGLNLGGYFFVSGI